MIYEYTIYPLEHLLEIILVILIGISDSYLLSIILLAVLVKLAIRPLEKYAGRLSESEIAIQSVLSKQIDGIKSRHSGSQRHEAIRRLYRRYSYRPFYAVRALSPLLIQLPFFIAAYYLLDGFTQFEGVIIPVLGDLAKPDILLFGKYHLMPFVMTAISILAVMTTPGFVKKSRIQGVIVTLVFLILLYTAPLALLIYWTTTNVFSLLSNLVRFPSLGIGKQFRNTKIAHFLEAYGYLLFVVGLAFLVPLLGVLGDQFTFFTAHALPAKEVVFLILKVLLIPVVILCVLRWLASYCGIVRFFDGLVLFAFLAIFLTFVFNNIGYGFFPAKYEPLILFCLSLFSAAVLAIYIIKAGLLHYLSKFSWIVLFIILHFIYVSPASTLFLEENKAGPSAKTQINNTPVFLIVFDEFSGTTLQTLKGKLDVLRYPGFAELASQADYFPNAMAPEYHTDIVVPSMLSGNLRIGSHAGLASDNNLIAMFNNLSSTHVYSSVLPAEHMYKGYENSRLLYSDLLVLYVHIIAHKDWIVRKIGRIPEAWSGFGFFGREKAFNAAGNEANYYVGQFYDWLDNDNEWLGNSQFNFMHPQFPHAPHDTTALGNRNKNGKSLLSLLKVKETLTAEQVNLNAAYHNYFLQSAYTDKLLGGFIRTLKENEIYDESLIIVTSDHGVSYDLSGKSRRVPSNAESWKNIISVPLLIKYPNQKAGREVPSIVSTLDISATIMGVIGIHSPWDSVGTDLAGIEGDVQTEAANQTFDYEKYADNVTALFQSARDRKYTLFGEGLSADKVAVNYTEDPVYDDFLYAPIQKFDVAGTSQLSAVYLSSTESSDITRYGVVSVAGRPVNGKLIVAAKGGIIIAVFSSGRAKSQDGFFAFTAPESMQAIDSSEVTLYEVEGSQEFLLQKIPISNGNAISPLPIFSSRKPISYDWKSSIQFTHGLDSQSLENNGIKFVSEKSDDPYVVFRPPFDSAVPEPIFRIKLRSNRDFSFQLYYKTVKNPKFNESQRLTHDVKKGMNEFYLMISEDNVLGEFRFDFGSGGVADVLLQDVEIRIK